jgi:hypothetical protein
MVRDADHVIVLAAGEIIERRFDRELIEKRGWFADFAHAVNGIESKESTSIEYAGLKKEDGRRRN